MYYEWIGVVFRGRVPDKKMLTLQPYQQAKASLFTGGGGCWLSSAEVRRMSAPVITGNDGAGGAC